MDLPGDTLLTMAKTGELFGGLVTLYSDGSFSMPEWVYVSSAAVIAVVVIVPFALIVRWASRR